MLLKVLFAAWNDQYEVPVLQKRDLLADEAVVSWIIRYCVLSWEEHDIKYLPG